MKKSVFGNPCTNRREFIKRPAEELYDCQKDPEKLNNVAYHPQYAKIRKKLAAKLMENLKLTNDPRVSGGREVFDHYNYYGGTNNHPDFKN